MNSYSYLLKRNAKPPAPSLRSREPQKTTYALEPLKDGSVRVLGLGFKV